MESTRCRWTLRVEGEADGGRARLVTDEEGGVMAPPSVRACMSRRRRARIDGKRNGNDARSAHGCDATSACAPGARCHGSLPRAKGSTTRSHDGNTGTSPPD